MPNIALFNLEVSNLKNLGQDRAVECVRRLLWAEAGRVDIGRNLINVPQCINVRDGGIDAFIKDANPTSDEVIPKGTSGFQIKSSDLRPGDCKKELHISKNLNKPLKPRIKRVLDDGGTYILILFADITSPEATGPREQAIRDELSRLHYSNPKIRLYTASQLIGFIERFPSLISWFKNDSSYCLPYESWAERSDIKKPKSFVFDKERKKFSEEIANQLRNPGGQCICFRIIGLSGIGKTRFVYEALASDDFKQRVIYLNADSFKFSPLYQTLQKDSNLSAIMVIDECDIQQHDDFVRSFSARGDRLALFTLSYEIGNVPPPSLSFKINKLSQESIESILSAEVPALPKNVIKRLSQFADGYPRIAVLLTDSYLANKNSNQRDFLDVSDEALMNRLIGSRNTNSDHFKKTKKVLQGISLFSKLGYEKNLSKEAEWVASIVNVSYEDFRDIVAEQRKRGIIQGRYFIYVTPFMFRIYLLKEWWESYGLTREKFNEFIESIPKEFRMDLLQRFFESIPYITTTEKGKEFTKALLGKNGIFSDGSLLKTKLGGDFFLKLTDADAESALKCLQATIGKWTKEELLNFKEGRRDVVWALQRIAVWKELFPEAARLLLALGEAENESYSNNASGVFMDLFSPGPDRVAPTEASLDERFPVLQESFNSTLKEKRLLVLGACDKALKTGRFSRIVGPEYQGLKEAQLWKPKSRQEIIDYYKRVWQLVYSKLDSFQGDEQEKAIDILLSNAQGLTYIPELAKMIISDIAELSDKPYSNKKEILKRIESILYFTQNKLPANIKHLWEQLRDNLAGNDFPSLMKRYVGMDLIEDKFDKDRKRIDKVGEYIDNLVEQIITENNLLESELPWLVTQEAANGFRFGYKLGKKDKNFVFLPMLLDAQRKVINNESASDYFLGGYLRALYEIKQDRWETLLDKLAKDKDFASWVPNLTWRSGISDRAALRVLNLANKGIINATHLRIFGYGSVISNISVKIFTQWIEFLLESTDDAAASIALDLYDFFYIKGEDKYRLPKELTFKLLMHPSLYKKPKQGRRDQMDDFHWTEIGIKFVQLYPSRSLKLADMIFEHFGKDGSILEGYQTETHKLINYISQKYPKEIWKKITKYLGPPIDSRAFNIKEWLRGEGLSEKEEGQLKIFSNGMVWEWVDKDIERRAWYLATFVPKVLFKQEGKICWARELLVRYGTRKDVKDNLAANFSSEVWWGPASLYFQQKKEDLLAFRKEEDNENVIKWIDGYVEELTRQIEYEKIDEERRDY